CRALRRLSEPATFRTLYPGHGVPAAAALGAFEVVVLELEDLPSAGRAVERDEWNDFVFGRKRGAKVVADGPRVGGVTLALVQQREARSGSAAPELRRHARTKKRAVLVVGGRSTVFSGGPPDGTEARIPARDLDFVARRRGRRGDRFRAWGDRRRSRRGRGGERRDLPGDALYTVDIGAENAAVEMDPDRGARPGQAPPCDDQHDAL